MQTEFGVLDRLQPIELSQMDAIRLMDRIDTKYLTDIKTLDAVLERAAADGYMVFDFYGTRIHRYRSMYYDTPELQMYLDHHNRRLVRQKLRTRYYQTTKQTFIELKNKSNSGRTKKKRLEISPEQFRMKTLDDGMIVDWLDGRLTYPRQILTPALETVFSRITLVNPEKTERSTIDFDLCFFNERSGLKADMGSLAIVEVKQDGNMPSRLREILLDCRVKPVRVSKYCIGTAMTDGTVKQGRFKQKLILIDKIMTQI